MKKNSRPFGRVNVTEAFLRTSIEGNRRRRGRLIHISDWEDLAQATVYSPADLARRCDVSLRHLQRYFHDCYGLRLGSWMNDLRLWRALLSLRAEDSVKEVAYALGYKQYSHFSREFKKFHGICPSAVRFLETQAGKARFKVSVAQAGNQLQFSLA